MPAKVDLEQLNNVLSREEKKQSPQAPQAVPKAKAAAPPGSKKKHESPLDRIPHLNKSFRLDSAINEAYKVATNYMNKKLSHNDLYVELQHSENGYSGKVVDLDSNKQVNMYDGVQILKLYAQNHDERGNIVNGQV